MGKSLIDDIGYRSPSHRRNFDKLEVLERAARREANWKPNMPSKVSSPRITATGGDNGYHMTAKAKARITLPKVWK